MGEQPTDLPARQVSRHQRELLTCRHFNGVWKPGMRRNTCAAGVDYREHAGGEDTGWVLALPCLPREVGRKYDRDVVPCGLREFPSEDEVEADEKRGMELAALVLRAAHLVIQHSGGKRGVIGVVTCPACGEDLRYSVSGHNGHTSGLCSTGGCLSWIQ